MKCDQQKPRCSHCVTYGADCTYAAPSRKSGRKKRPSFAKTDDTTSSTQERLKHLGALVEQLTERVHASEKCGGVQVRPQLGNEALMGQILPLMVTGEGRDAKSAGGGRTMILPPLVEVITIMEIFFEKFNSVLPPLDPGVCRELVSDLYNSEVEERDPVAWAAVNIVLALTYQKGLLGSSKTSCSIVHRSRAESVVSAVVLRQTRLLNVQVLVGMVMLSRAAPGLQHSLVLSATMMRLAHTLGLQSRASSAHLDVREARQRAHVFWMAYILDKDFSMRSRQPSIQLDDDIDLDLPSQQAAEYHIDDGHNANDADIDAGIITTMDDTVKLNYLAARIQLATIEGGIYDYLYSTRSQKRSSEERFQALESVIRALEKWKASIPPEFSASMAPHTVSPDKLHFLEVLHSTSLSCSALMEQSIACNPHYVELIRGQGLGSIMSLLPHQSEEMVEEARHLTLLLGSSPIQDRCNMWITCCPRITAMMTLTYNNIQRPAHEKLALDN